MNHGRIPPPCRAVLFGQGRGRELAGWLADHTDGLMPCLQAAGYMLLAIYFDAVLPDANGVRRPPWFFLQPGYWFPAKVRGLVLATLLWGLGAAPAS